MTKNKYIILTFFILLIAGILYLDRGWLYIGSAKIGGWQEVDQKLAKRFADNVALKKAALQMGTALQAAVDNPEDAQRIVLELSDAMGCVRAILEKQGKRDQASNILSEIEDISTAGFNRERRYIRFNSNLSGGVYKMSETSISKCQFKMNPKDK